MIPMVDLKAQYHSLKETIDAGILQALENTQFILGPNVQALEQEIAEYLGVAHAISCASGTDALHLALLASGACPGDEIITTAFTFIATAEAIRYVGARPVFVDIDPRTFNIDVAKVAAAITPRTHAVLPVHLFGQPANLPALQSVCEQEEIALIEDCAQSFGASIDGRYTGTIGETGCFSFFPSKNLGCFGDGGLITTQSASIADTLRVLRNHGSRERYHHDLIGFNSRLDEIQAVVLRAKLAHIDQYNQQRRRVAQRYTSLLADTGIITPYEDGVGEHVYHQYTLLSDQRDKLMAALREADIASAVYYPIPLHQQKAFAEQCAGLSLPVTESVAGRCLSLPMYPELDDAAIVKITDTLKAAL